MEKKAKTLFEYVDEERELRKLRFQIIIAMLGEDAILLAQVRTYLN